MREEGLGAPNPGSWRKTPLGLKSWSLLPRPHSGFRNSWFYTAAPPRQGGVGAGQPNARLLSGARAPPASPQGRGIALPSWSGLGSHRRTHHPDTARHQAAAGLPATASETPCPGEGGGTPDLGPEVAFFSLTARLRQRPNLARAPPYPACLGKLRE